MGNTFSSSNALHVQLKKTYYYPGEFLEGVVALNCLTQIPTSGIHVEIVGYEETVISRTESSGSNSRTVTYRGHHDFYRVRIPLGGPGTLNAGQYQFAFNVQLPMTLPPTIKYKYGSDAGKIKYKVLARVEKHGFDIKGEAEVVVVDRPPLQLHPVGNAAEKNVKMLCCISEGNLFVQMNLDKDCFSRGEDITVAVQARNSTQKDFKAIRVELKRRINLYARGVSEVHNLDCARVDGEGLKAGQNAEGSMARHLTLRLPTDLLPSVAGQLLQCYYVLEVEMRGGLRLSDVRTQVPIRISAAPSTGGGQVPIAPAPDADIFAAPEGWNPQTFAAVDVPAPRETPNPNAEIQTMPSSMESGPIGPLPSTAFYYPPPINSNAPSAPAYPPPVL